MPPDAAPQAPPPLAKLEPAPAAAGRAGRYGAMALAAFVAAMAAAVCLNVAVDPRGEFPGNAYTPLTADSVAVKEALFDRWPGEPHVLVLGSSRAMAWPPEALGAGDGFNYALSAGTPRDFLLVWEHVARSRGVPDVLVVGADAFSLQPPRAQYDSQVLRSEAADEVAGMHPAPGELARRAVASLSSGYLQDSLRVLQYTYVTGYPEGAHWYDADGVRHVRDAPATPAARGAAVQQHAQAVLPKVYGLSSVWGEQLPVDGAQQERWHALLDRAAANGTRVVAILPPIHPEGLDRVGGEAGFQQFQQAMRALLLRHCGPLVEVLDYTRVEAYGGSPSGFLDSFHTDAAQGRLMLQAAAQGRGALC